MRSILFAIWLFALALCSWGCGASVENGHLSEPGGEDLRSNVSALAYYQAHFDAHTGSFSISPTTAKPDPMEIMRNAFLPSEYLHQSIPFNAVTIPNGTIDTYDQGENKIRFGQSGSCGLQIQNTSGQHLLNLQLRAFSFSQASVSLPEGATSQGEGSYFVNFGDVANGETSCAAFSLQNSNNSDYTVALALEGTPSGTLPTDYISSINTSVLVIGETVTITGKGLNSGGTPTVQIGSDTVSNLSLVSDTQLQFVVTAGMAGWEGSVTVNRVTGGSLTQSYFYKSTPLDFNIQMESGTLESPIYFRHWSGYGLTQGGCIPDYDLVDAEILNRQTLSTTAQTLRMNFNGFSGSTQKVYIAVDNNQNRIIDAGDHYYTQSAVSLNASKINTINAIPVTLGTAQLILQDCDNPSCYSPPCPPPSGNGDGTFSGSTDLGLYRGFFFNTGDLDNDGDIDIVLREPVYDNEIHYIENLGSRNFSTPVLIEAYSKSVGYIPLVADFNKDGNLDIVESLNGNGPSSIDTIRFGDGSLGFGSVANISADREEGSNLSAGDYNNDGNLDLLVANNPDPVRVFLGDGTGGFVPGTVWPANDPGFGSQVTSVDLNNDGNLDLLVSGSYLGSKMFRLLGDGTGGFSAALEVCPEIDGFNRPFAVGDYNEDGNQDFIIGYSYDRGIPPQLCLGNGDGTFTHNGTVHASLSGAANGAFAADFNGDGHLDVFLAGRINGDISSFRFWVVPGVGDGTFATPLVHFISGGGIAYSPIVEDFDGDGKLDVFFNRGGLEIRIYWGQ